MTTTAGRVYAGLRPGTTTDSLRVAVSNGALADHLACFAPKPGDAILLPAGTVHAIGRGHIMLLPAVVGTCPFRPRMETTLLEVGLPGPATEERSEGT